MNTENPSYEDSLQEIEDIVSKLEKGEIGVDEIAKLVKRASTLLEFCQDQLRKIEKDVQESLNDE